MHEGSFDKGSTPNIADSITQSFHCQLTHHDRVEPFGGPSRACRETWARTKDGLPWPITPDAPFGLDEPLQNDGRAGAHEGEG
jgi:hypothetical protein